MNVALYNSTATNIRESLSVHI